MICSHCQKSIDRSAFEEHCNEHAQIQKILQRPTGRQYGARYDPGNGTDTQNRPPPSATTPVAPRNNNILVSRHKPDMPPEEPSIDPSMNVGVETRGLDSRVASIARRFPAYRDDGIESPYPISQELKCRDCAFKFRSPVERDEHHLSEYCAGNNVRYWLLYIDHSKPGGYRIEEETVPFNGKSEGSLFACDKCPSTFLTEEEMESHRLTHPLEPSKCLHCGKVFGTKYELEGHYDWHDDMELRNRIDSLRHRGDDTGVNEVPSLEEPTEEVDLGQGLRLIPFPFAIGKRQRPWKNGDMVAASYISGEDLELNFAPQGKFRESPRSYMSVPKGMNQETVDKLVANYSAKHSQKGKEDERGRLQGESGGTNSHPNDEYAPPFTILGHGRPGHVQVTTVSGQVRWVTGTVLAQVTPMRGNRLISATIKSFLAQADLAEKANDLNGARDCFIQAFDLMQQDRIGWGAEKEVISLLTIALLSSKMKMPTEAIDHYMKALDLSEKVYGKDGINNFTIINKMAIEFETQGHFKEAECLYRRSLAGRLKEHGPDHLDSVMTTQELGTIINKLGNREMARRLLEAAYIGFENLAEPDEETALVTLNNLAATYSELGMNEDAARLISIAMPRLLQIFGHDHDKLPYTVCNYLRLNTKATINEEVLELLNAYQSRPSEPAVTALESYAHFLVEHSQVKQAVNIYQTLFRWRKTHLGMSDPKTIAALWGLAECLDTLDIFDEAEESFEMITRTPRISSITGGESYLSASAVRIKHIQRRKNDLQRESISWGLDKAEPCACGQSTFRLCSGCHIPRFCSLSCEDGATDHKAQCYPSVTPAQSRRVQSLEQPFEREESMFQELFSHDPTIKKPPKLISTRAYYVDPDYFATVRIRKETQKIVSMYFISDEARYAMHDVHSFQWLDRGRLYLYSSEEEVYLFLAPGKTMVERVSSEFTATTGSAKCGLDLPDKDLIEFLQTKPLKNNEMRLALIMMVWES